MAADLVLVRILDAGLRVVDRSCYLGCAARIDLTLLRKGGMQMSLDGFLVPHRHE